MAYSRSTIVDADNPTRVLALTEGQGVSIGIPPDGLQKMEHVPVEVVDSDDLPPLWQAFGGARRPDGHWVLPELSAEVASPDAALHIGPQFVILETAAVDVAAGGGRTDQLQGTASHVMFLRVEGRPVPRRGAAACRRRRHRRRARATSRRGQRDKAITAASYVFRC